MQILSSLFLSFSPSASLIIIFASHKTTNTHSSVDERATARSRTDMTVDTSAQIHEAFTHDKESKWHTENWNKKKTLKKDKSKIRTNGQAKQNINMQTIFLY